MKKNIFLILLCFFAFSGVAQSDLYLKVRKAIETNYPEIQTQDRLIAINFWSAGDLTSRDLNKAFNKNYNIYKFARLKGGMKGLIGVSVCIDDLSTELSIMLNKDGAGDLLKFTLADVSLAEKPFNNVVFDSAGKKVYSDLKAGEVFNKINQLITR